jgi:hypothetical protein
MSLIESIVYYTNKYKNDQDREGHDVTAQEMLRFFGLLIAHAVCTSEKVGQQLPRDHLHLEPMATICHDIVMT